jgi:DDE superfamily endonuclease
MRPRRSELARHRPVRRSERRRPPPPSFRIGQPRADTLFELTDAVLCIDRPVTSLAELSLAAEHRRGHGALYDSVNQGRIDIGRFRNVVARQQIPRCDDGRIALAIDVSNWLRPDAATSPDRLFCHTYGRGKGQAQVILGWTYSFVVALEPGRTSWTAILDAQRLGPDDEDTAVAAAQLRVVVEGLIAAGHWTDGDPEIWIVGDTGYDGPRLAFLLADLPVRLLMRVRSDRVMAFPAAPTARGSRWAQCSSRSRVQVQRFPDMARGRSPHDHPDHEIRHRASLFVGSAASQADPPWHLGRPRRRRADH